MARNQVEFNQLLERISANSYNDETLSLECLRLTDADVQRLVQALAVNTTITHLNLGYNQIGAAGAQALATTTTITHLNVAYNEIGDAGAQALATTTTIEHLNLSHNQISAAGAKALAARNITITHLHVTHLRSGYNYQIRDIEAINAKQIINRAVRKGLCFAFHLFGTAANQGDIAGRNNQKKKINIKSKNGTILPLLSVDLVNKISEYLPAVILQSDPGMLKKLEYPTMKIKL